MTYILLSPPLVTPTFGHRTTRRIHSVISTLTINHISNRLIEYSTTFPPSLPLSLYDDSSQFLSDDLVVRPSASPPVPATTTTSLSMGSTGNRDLCHKKHQDKSNMFFPLLLSCDVMAIAVEMCACSIVWVFKLRLTVNKLVHGSILPECT